METAKQGRCNPGCNIWYIICAYNCYSQYQSSITVSTLWNCHALYESLFKKTINSLEGSATVFEENNCTEAVLVKRCSIFGFVPLHRWKARIIQCRQASTVNSPSRFFLLLFFHQCSPRSWVELPPAVAAIDEVALAPPCMFVHNGQENTMCKTIKTSCPILSANI